MKRNFVLEIYFKDQTFIMISIIKIKSQRKDPNWNSQKLIWLSRYLESRFNKPKVKNKEYFIKPNTQGHKEWPQLLTIENESLKF